MRDESHLIVHDFSNKQFSSLKRIIKVIKDKNIPPHFNHIGCSSDFCVLRQDTLKHPKNYYCHTLMSIL